MAATNNRYAAYHCQQAAEKLIKAVPGGRIVPAPDPAQVSADANAIEGLIDGARAELK